MPWTGGYPVGVENIVIPTGIFVEPDDARGGVFVANVQVTQFQVYPAIPNGQTVTWSVTSRVRFRRRWTVSGGFFVPATQEELIVSANIVPVEVSDAAGQVRATQVRWSVWRVT